MLHLTPVTIIPGLPYLHSQMFTYFHSFRTQMRHNGKVHTSIPVLNGGSFTVKTLTIYWDQSAMDDVATLNDKSPISLPTNNLF